jgi:hypothetical protein
VQGTDPVVLHVIHALFHRGAAVPSPHVVNGVFQHAFHPLLIVMNIASWLELEYGANRPELDGPSHRVGGIVYGLLDRDHGSISILGGRYMELKQHSY